MLIHPDQAPNRMISSTSKGTRRMEVGSTRRDVASVSETMEAVVRNQIWLELVETSRPSGVIDPTAW